MTSSLSGFTRLLYIQLSRYLRDICQGCKGIPNYKYTLSTKGAPCFNNPEDRSCPVCKSSKTKQCGISKIASKCGKFCAPRKNKIFFVWFLKKIFPQWRTGSATGIGLTVLRSICVAPGPAVLSTARPSQATASAMKAFREMESTVSIRTELWQRVQRKLSR